MNKVHISELVFEVTEEAEGGYSAECLTENIFTQGDTWEELRANVSGNGCPESPTNRCPAS